jgi:hypothetical protein
MITIPNIKWLLKKGAKKKRKKIVGALKGWNKLKLIKFWMNHN